MHGLGELLVVWKISGKYFSLKTQSTHYVEILLEGEFSFSQSIHKGTIHLRRRQIFTIFDPYPPTIGIPAKCFWRGFLILMYCDFSTISTWGHPSPIRHADILNGWSQNIFYKTLISHFNVTPLLYLIRDADCQCY